MPDDPAGGIARFRKADYALLGKLPRSLNSYERGYRRDSVSGDRMDNNVTKPKKKRKRKRSAKELADRAAFFARKMAERKADDTGQFTNDGLDRVKWPSNSPVAASTAVLDASEAEVGTSSHPAADTLKIDVIAHPPEGSSTVPWHSLPLPQPTSEPIAPEATLTLIEAENRHYPIDYLILQTKPVVKLFRYRKPGDAGWTACAGQAPEAPPAPQGLSYTQKYGSVVSPQALLSRPPCQGVCTCSDRDCGRR